MFSNASIRFLRSLARNNDRTWFQTHRDAYERDVRAPMVAIVDRLSHDFRRFAPDLVADPKVSLFRPWRDTRFSEDKSPLKTNIAAVFPNRRLGRMNGAGLYVEVAARWVWIGGGLYAPNGQQLQAVREHIASHQRRFERLLAAPAFKKLGGLQGETLTRVPRGWASDHPSADYLRHKQFLAIREEPAAFAARPDFYPQLLATLKAMAPLVAFLNEPLVERLEIERRGHLLDETADR